jgi:hypothetical protein
MKNPAKKVSLGVKQNHPFLPGISSKLLGRMPRRKIEAYRLFRQQLLNNSISDYAQLFSEILPIDFLSQAQNTVRTRCYPEVVTFWARI